MLLALFIILVLIGIFVLARLVWPSAGVREKSFLVLIAAIFCGAYFMASSIEKDRVRDFNEARNLAAQSREKEFRFQSNVENSKNESNKFLIRVKALDIFEMSWTGNESFRLDDSRRNMYFTVGVYASDSNIRFSQPSRVIELREENGRRFTIGSNESEGSEEKYLVSSTEVNKMHKTVVHCFGSVEVKREVDEIIGICNSLRISRI